MELKVLILDDEYIILDGLCSFPWENYGCCVVGSAGDGAEGLDLAKQYQPDIVLTDIKMPVMDGLRFARHVKNIYPDTEIIFLTGYDNFAYAQQAVRIGVVEYLLKPVNFREMHAVIEKVCTRVREKRRYKKDYSELRKKFQQTLPLVKSKLISDLIYGRLKDHREMEERMNLLNMQVDKYVLVYARVKTPEEYPTKELEPGLFDFVVCNICEESLKDCSLQVYSEMDTLGYCFIVVFSRNMAEKDCIHHCVRACEEIRKNVNKVIQTDISFGISTVQTDVYVMNLCYKQGVEACESNVYMGDETSVLEYSDVADVQTNTWNITEGEKKRLFSEIAQGNVETAKSFVAEIFAACTDLENMRYVAMELLVGCFQYMGHESAVFHTNMEKNTLLPDTIEKMYSCHTRKDLLETLKKALSFMADKRKGEQINRKQRTAQNILDYIELHYAEDISLDMLSDYFKISKTYITRLLKNNAGKSFLEILLDIRMTKAEQLIDENRFKVYEVAEMVGYHDLSYFIRAFKKKYGVTPNVYKRI